MAKECAICGKKGKIVWNISKLRGKYNPTTKRRQQPNLQSLYIPKDTKKKKFKEFAGRKVTACTKCRRTLAKKAK